MKNSPVTTISSPLSGTVTSTNAQGILPQYRGSAVASLTPSMAHAPVPHIVSQIPPSKLTHSDSVGSFRLENHPPSRANSSVEQDPFTAADLLRKITSQDLEHQAAEGWNINTTGTGPISGSDW
jgi:hypothetical protein